MARRKIKMRPTREMFRLFFEGKNQSFIKIATGISHKTQKRYISYASIANLNYDKIKTMSDDALEAIIIPSNKNRRNKAQPDWNEIHHEMQSNKAATKIKLWEEFISSNPDGVGYTQFCDHYQKFISNRDPVLRQNYRYGEKMFLDFAGMTVPILDPKTMQINFCAQIFVSVLGASNYSFAYAVKDQSLNNWIDCNVKALEFYGGVTKEIVIDNLKSGVIKASKYEPLLNQTYEDLSAHYETTIIPARPYKPKDKAKVEKGVQIVERSILFVLRKHKFFSLAELNQAIEKLLESLNNKPLQKQKVSRKQLFDEFEKEELKTLPKSRYEIVEFRTAKVNINYHVEYQGCNYSVPHKFIGKEIEIRASTRLVRIIYNNSVIASHQRKFKPGEYSTVHEHMPQKHREYLDWSPEKMINWAATVGAHTQTLVKQMLNQKVYPTQAYKSIMGIISLAKKYDINRVELAAYRIHSTGCPSGAYRRLKNILENGLDKLGENECFSVQLNIGLHENIRGVYQ